MNVAVSLTAREADAVLRAALSMGYGVRRSQALQAAEFKIREAIIAAQQGDNR